MIPYEFDAERFSRWMSYVLRHNPSRYGLSPDRHGYVDLESFVLIAKRRYPSVDPTRLRALIESGNAARFEVAGDRLRARYGHSIAVEPPGLPIEPPPRLYHGTQDVHAETIRTQGLTPSDRRMIHLSETIDEALAVARRRTDHPAVFRILAREAHAAGVAFYQEGKVYLVVHIPAIFVSLEPLPFSDPAGTRSDPHSATNPSSTIEPSPS